MVALAAPVALPLIGLCALMVRATSPGPALFRQERVGLGGRRFRVLKLRTMVDSPEGNPLIPDPARITPVGRWLRLLSLDELPQIVNIARGEMSVVGPRPTLPYQVERYDQRQRQRLRVRPGLTGLAQISGRNSVSWAERIEHDLRYIEAQSPWLDLIILTKTAAAVFTRAGVDGHAADDPISLPPHDRVATARAGEPQRDPLAYPKLGDEEIAAVAAVLRSGVLTNGPVTEQFERDFGARHGVEHAVAFANGTVALAAMFIAAGIGEGDEVVVPSMTFISTATSVLHVGAAPVFADVDAESFNLDPEDVARKLTPRTRAILAVHYGGQPAEMDELRSIAEGAGIAPSRTRPRPTGPSITRCRSGAWGMPRCSASRRPRTSRPGKAAWSRPATATGRGGCGCCATTARPSVTVTRRWASTGGSPRCRRPSAWSRRPSWTGSWR